MSLPDSNPSYRREVSEPGDRSRPSPGATAGDLSPGRGPLPPGSLASGLSDSNPSSRQVAQIDASYVLDWLRQSERLQGLPDGWTQLGGTPDSRRYSALGDAVTATVAEWIGRRLMEAECA